MVILVGQVVALGLVTQEQELEALHLHLVKEMLVVMRLQRVISPYILLVVVALMHRVTQAQKRWLGLVEQVRHRQLQVLLYLVLAVVGAVLVVQAVSVLLVVQAVAVLVEVILKMAQTVLQILAVAVALVAVVVLRPKFLVLVVQELLF
jgi:hypothetical protein